MTITLIRHDTELSVLAFMGEILDIFNEKRMNVSSKSEDPNFPRIFWKLYKNKNSELYELFPKGKVWKDRNGKWWFYFNE